ncbi:MAG: hypothetical protein DMF61_08180 [Blastocatellia bacterium AA13]|nr:MAG: hypothetical protein DMF61_08180 [Blastocatellia bacterium AA13]
MRPITIAILSALVAVLSAPGARGVEAPGYLYVGAWPNKIVVIDEATYKVQSEIPIESGIPEYILASYDRRRLVAITGQRVLEVVDLVNRKVAGRLQLCEPNQTQLVISSAIDPRGRFLYLTLKTATKEVDRYSIQKARFHIIDLDLLKIVKTFDFPKDFDQGFGFEDAAYRVSADGRFLYVLKDDVLVFDLNTFQQVDKIELSKPSHPGASAISFAGETDPKENPDFITSVFTSTDLQARRSISGIARVNLLSKKVDLIPLAVSLSIRGRLYVSPDGKKAFVVTVTSPMDPNRRCEFWVFDLQSRKLIKKAEFENRARFTFAASSDAKKLYIYGPGPIIDIYDAETLTLDRTITVDGDITEMAIVPSR